MTAVLDSSGFSALIERRYNKLHYYRFDLHPEPASQIAGFGLRGSLAKILVYPLPQPLRQWDAADLKAQVGATLAYISRPAQKLSIELKELEKQA